MLQVDLAAEIHAAVRVAFNELRAELVTAIELALANRLLTIDEAAEVRGCSPAALRKQVARGHVRSVRLGRTIRIRLSDLLAPNGAGGE